MTQIRNGLGLILLGCLGVRLAAWLVTPFIPLIAVVFGLAALACLVTSHFRRL